MTDIYLDIETQRTDKDVPGGWDNISAFGFACAVTYCECHHPVTSGRITWLSSPGEGGYIRWLARGTSEDGQVVADLLLHLAEHDRIIGHNLIKFDYAVLAAYPTGIDVYARLVGKDKTLDTLKYLLDKKKANRYVSLDSLALATLGHGKSGSGADAPVLWRAGKYDELLAYCEQDVRLLVELVAFAREHGYVLTQRVDVEW